MEINTIVIILMALANAFMAFSMYKDGEHGVAMFNSFVSGALTTLVFV